MTPPERLEKCQAVTSPSYKLKPPHLVAVSHGASRTRTGDLLGAISALSGPGFGLVERLQHLCRVSPNTFPNTLRRVLQ